MALDLLLFGPPGAGKGTQAAAIASAAGVPHVATGDMFRGHLSQSSELGMQAKAYMDKGALVPDTITIAMLSERLAGSDAEAGLLLDGFPRTVAQAEALDDMLDERGRQVTALLSIEVPEDELVRRVSGRLVCRDCGTPYHEHEAPPKVAGACDRCGGEVIRRVDDNESTVRARHAVFREQTEPVLAYYREQGTPIVEVDGARDRAAVEADLLAAVAELSPRPA
jgi:adenylate kinase